MRRHSDDICTESVPTEQNSTNRTEQYKTGQTFAEAILEAQDIALQDPRVILIGEGVPDPKNIFGTTTGLKEKYPDQVFDSPVSEAGVTGACIGLALNGFKPIHTHQRIDFSLYAADQIINNAAKWYSMFGGARSVPMVIRMTIGRGWGQGHQHCQNLAALYAHIPGLKVFMPSNAKDAKEMFLEAVADPNPVLFLEHKWLYPSTHGPYERKGTKDGTVVSWGYAMHEAEALAIKEDYTLIDLKRLNPIDVSAIQASMEDTDRLIIIDDAWNAGSIAHTVRSMVPLREYQWCEIHTCPNSYPASTAALNADYYPKFIQREIHDVDPFTNKVTSAI